MTLLSLNYKIFGILYNTTTLLLSSIYPLMLHWTLIGHSITSVQNTYYFLLFVPRYYPLTPFTPVQPNSP